MVQTAERPTTRQPVGHRVDRRPFAVLLLVAALVLGGVVATQWWRESPAGRVTVSWDPPAPAEESLQTVARQSVLLSSIPDVLAADVLLPHDVSIRFASGSGSAAYDDSTRTLTFPYGFLQTIRGGLQASRPQASAADLDAATGPAAAAVLLHEIGHMLVAAYRLPVLGSEEVVADTFAAASVRMVGDQLPDTADALLAYADFLQGYAGGQQGVDLFDDHLPAALRAARMRCLVYGENPTARADLLTGATAIPQPDAPYCQADFTEAHDSWVAVLDRYRT